MKKLSWWRRWYYNQTYRMIGLKAGPIMLNMRGEYLYVDPYGSIWRVVPTGQNNIPLSIELFRRG